MPADTPNEKQAIEPLEQGPMEPNTLRQGIQQRARRRSVSRQHTIPTARVTAKPWIHLHAARTAAEGPQLHRRGFM